MYKVSINSSIALRVSHPSNFLQKEAVILLAIIYVIRMEGIERKGHFLTDLSLTLGSVQPDNVTRLLNWPT